MLSFLQQPWPWYVSGPLFSMVMVALLLNGGELGISSTLRTACAMSGAGKKVRFFNFHWPSQLWNVVFAIGTLLGGYFAASYLVPTGYSPQLATSTVASLQEMGLAAPSGFLPSELLNLESLLSLKGFTLMILGGFFVGFGARYAGGCTSGHAISGLANLQLPSLIAVMGFFIGGLLVTYLFLPFILSL